MRAVYRVFTKLYEKGWIYRDNYMVNWDPGLQSAISDLEMETREVTDTLYEIVYPLEDGGELVVATVRPETMLADTAVAVNPNDERYSALIGKRAMLPLVGRRLPVIADDFVDPEFGTGALKITPGHDPNDFEIGRKHGLEEISVIGEDGRITDAAPEQFRGMTVDEAREAVVAELRDQGLIRGEEPYTHNVPFSHRSGERIEPLISLQWFCRMDEMAKPAIEVVRDGRVRFIPAKQGEVYLEWMERIRPWCISRQLWWGHRLPVWYRGEPDEEPEIYVGEQPPEGEGWEQDHDVLDTWFSSALWPFATLGWPDTDAPGVPGLLPDRRALDGARHHLPLGRADDHDLARVHRRGPVQRRLRALGDPGPRRAADVEEPRHRDRPARRDRGARRRRPPLRPPRDVLDPGRALLRGAREAGPRPRQQDLERVAADPAERAGRRHAAAPARDLVEDRWIASRLQRAIASVTESVEGYDFAHASLDLYEFFWSELCDWYLEIVKARLYGEGERGGRGRLGDAALGARAGAGARAPVHALRHRGGLLVHAGPRVRGARHPPLPGARRGPDRRGGRGRDRKGDRADRERCGAGAIWRVFPPGRSCRRERTAPTARAGRAAGAGRVRRRDGDAIATVDGVELLETEGVDPEAVAARIEERREKLRSEVERGERKLGNEGFVAKAPADVVDAEREKLAAYRAELGRSCGVSWPRRADEILRRAREPIGWHLGLERMRRLCSLLGMPQNRFASIHVVGTNGKTSVARMTAALLDAHGVAAGAYLSPHINDWRERIVIGGEPIGEAAFAEALERAEQAAEVADRAAGEEGPVTQFELVTAAAFVALAAARVKVGGDRGRPRRQARRHQRDPLARHGPDLDRPRPHRVAGRDRWRRSPARSSPCCATAACSSAASFRPRSTKSPSVRSSAHHATVVGPVPSIPRSRRRCRPTSARTSAWRWRPPG